MIYLSQMFGRPVVDSNGEEIGKISDLAIAAGEVFPRITSLAFRGPSKTPFMVSWRKHVEQFDGDKVILNKPAHEIRFSYLQPDEILLTRDLMNKQIVDTQGMRVVRVNDMKFSDSGNQFRLLGAEVGIRGILRGLSPQLESAVMGLTRLFRHPLQENIIAWNYMDLLDRDLSQVKLSVSHKRLHELHPADVADILEQLDPQQRASVFAHLDNAQAAETISELEDEYQSDVIDDLSEARASKLLAQMDPDDAADIIGDLPYEKAEKLLRLMGVQEEHAIRSLLGYKEKTAGGIMTTEFFAMPEDATVGETVEALRKLDEDHESVQYVYTVTSTGKLTGVLSMRTLVLATSDRRVGDLAFTDLITTNPETDQEEVASDISKYNILAMPVVDETNKLLGIVTVDDALDVMEEEHDEDLAIAGATKGESAGGPVIESLKNFIGRELWFIVWVVAALAITLSGSFTFFAGALVLMPIVLVIAGDVAAFAINALIEYEGEEDTPLSTMLARDLVVGLLVAALCGLLVGIFAAALSGQQTGDVLTAVSGALPAVAITIFLSVASCAFLSKYARRRHDKGKLVSLSRMTVIVMILALVVQLLLTYASHLMLV